MAPVNAAGPGRLVRHGRRLVLRLARSHPGTEALVRAHAQLFAPAP